MLPSKPPARLNISAGQGREQLVLSVSTNALSPLTRTQTLPVTFSQESPPDRPRGAHGGGDWWGGKN